jgi:hypothetical protein
MVWAQEGAGYEQYFGVKYRVPVSSLKDSWGGIDLEAGRVFDNGLFYGFDLGGGGVGVKYGWAEFGGGASVGYALNPLENARLILGLSLGLWWGGSEIKLNDLKTNVNCYNIFGPTARLQWHGKGDPVSSFIKHEVQPDPFVLVEFPVATDERRFFGDCLRDYYFVLVIYYYR